MNKNTYTKTHTTLLKRLAAFTFGALAVMTPLANAQTIIVGSFAGNNAFPFGTNCTGVTPPAACPSSFQVGGRYQQIYAASAFPGPVTITQIAFASSATSGNPGSANINMTLRLGTTSSSPASPSNTFAVNGTPPAVAFSGALTPSFNSTNNAINFSAFDFIIPLTTPFTYNPANGNLLLDVVINAPISYTNGILSFEAGASNSVGRVYNPAPGTTGTTDGSGSGFGLYTQFTTGSSTPPPTQPPATPIPPSVILSLTGLLGIGLYLMARSSFGSSFSR